MDNSPTGPGSRNIVWEQNTAVRNYFEGMQPTSRKGKMRRSPEKLRARIAEIDMEVNDAPVLRKLSLMQEKMDIEEAMSESVPEVDMAMLESEFVKHARGFADRKGISYATLRKMGASTDALKRAGITR